MFKKYEKIIPLDNPTWNIMESIVINECGEPLVPVSISSIIKTYPVYYKMGVGNAIPECFVRESLLNKLIDVANGLPKGINLVVLDGWRPYQVQQFLYETLLTYLIESPENQGADLNSLIEKTRNVVSPARYNSLCPSPHLTGGAVDVTLCDDAGRLLNMGTAFDENSPLSWTAALESRADEITFEIINNRRMLYNAMTEVGFTNLPSEWWHYDYGDQLWAYFNNKPTAIYGVTCPLKLEQLWNS